MGLNGARTPLADQIEHEWPPATVDRFLARAVDQLRLDTTGEIKDLAAEVASLRRTFWVFIGALFSLAAGLISVAAALA